MHRYRRHQEPVSQGRGDLSMAELGGPTPVILQFSLPWQKADRFFFPGCFGRHALTRASHCDYHTSITVYLFLLFASLT